MKKNRVVVNKATKYSEMKLVTILIIVQAIFMLASLAGSGYIMYSIKNNTASQNGEKFFKDASIPFYITMALTGTSLMIHGLLTFWCKK